MSILVIVKHDDCGLPHYTVRHIAEKLIYDPSGLTLITKGQVMSFDPTELASVVMRNGDPNNGMSKRIRNLDLTKGGYNWHGTATSIPASCVIMLQVKKVRTFQV